MLSGVIASRTSFRIVCRFFSSLSLGSLRGNPSGSRMINRGREENGGRGEKQEQKEDVPGGASFSTNAITPFDDEETEETGETKEGEGSGAAAEEEEEEETEVGSDS